MDNKQITEQILEIREFIAEIRTIYDSQQKRIERIEKCLFGNGRLGIAHQVAIIVAVANAILLILSNVIAHFIF